MIKEQRLDIKWESGTLKRTISYEICAGGAMYAKSLDDAVELIRYYDFKQDDGDGIGIYVGDLIIQVSVDK